MIDIVMLSDKTFAYTPELNRNRGEVFIKTAPVEMESLKAAPQTRPYRNTALR